MPFEHPHGTASVQEFLHHVGRAWKIKCCFEVYGLAFAGAAAIPFRILSLNTFLWFASSTSNR